MEQLEAIRNAAQLMAVRPSTASDRLLQAGDVFWSAMYATSEWPPGLHERIAELAGRLMADGSVEATLDRLDESGLEELAGEILKLAGQIDDHLHAPV